MATAKVEKGEGGSEEGEVVYMYIQYTTYEGKVKKVVTVERNRKLGKRKSKNKEKAWGRWKMDSLWRLQKNDNSLLSGTVLGMESFVCSAATFPF